MYNFDLIAYWISKSQSVKYTTVNTIFQPKTNNNRSTGQETRTLLQ